MSMNFYLNRHKFDKFINFFPDLSYLDSDLEDGPCLFNNSVVLVEFDEDYEGVKRNDVGEKVVTDFGDDILDFGKNDDYQKAREEIAEFIRVDVERRMKKMVERRESPKYRRLMRTEMAKIDPMFAIEDEDADEGLMGDEVTGDVMHEDFDDVGGYSQPIVDSFDVVPDSYGELDTFVPDSQYCSLFVPDLEEKHDGRSNSSPNLLFFFKYGLKD